MPELPEVETIVRELNQRLPGRSIGTVRVFRADALGETPEAIFRAELEGRRFGAVKRRGKYLVFGLQPSGYLVGHLRMTGKFALVPRPRFPEAHHRVWFELTEGEVLVFQDVRCLGTLEVTGNPEEVPGIARLGIDPLSRRFTPTWMAGALAGSRMPLKSWLMDQTKVAGLGNIYVAEILFASRLSPLRPANTLHRGEIDRLIRATRGVLRQAIRKNGTTISDYRRVDDKQGEFQDFLKVYDREGEPCFVCHTSIRRVVQAQRSTYYCPTCQS